MAPHARTDATSHSRSPSRRAVARHLRGVLISLARDDLAADRLERTWLPDLRPLLVQSALGHGLASVLHDRLDERGLDPGPLLAAQRARGAVRRLSARASLAVLGSALDRAGIAWVTFKGPVVAARHARPDHREFNDLDVAVPAADLAAAVDAIVGAGGVSLNRNWAGFRRFGVTELPLAHGPTRVDLHCHLIGLARIRRRFSLDVVGMLDRRRHVQIGDLDVPTFDPTDQMLHLCLHAGLEGANRMTLLRDVASVATADPPDWEVLRRRSRDYGCSALVGQVLDRSCVVLGASIPAEVPAQLTPAPLLAARHRLDRWTPPLRKLPVRVFPAPPVSLSRDRAGPMLDAAARTALDRLRSLTPWPERWDVDDEAGPVYWGRCAGGSDERDRYFESLLR